MCTLLSRRIPTRILNSIQTLFPSPFTGLIPVPCPLLSLCSDIQTLCFLQIAQHKFKMYWSEINGSWGSSVVCRQCAGSRPLPLRLSWWTACFPMLERTCLNRSLGCLNLCLSVRRPPVMSFLPTTSVVLQAPFLFCRLDNSIAKKEGSCCTLSFQIPYLYIPGDRMVYLLINKEAENRQKYFWNIEACTCISGK